MQPITQEQLDGFKKLYPSDAPIQALTLSQVQEHAQEKVPDWKTLQFPAEPAITNERFRTLAAATSLGLSDCQMNIGYVIFDCICLALGAVGLRKAVSGTTIEAIFHAAAPSISKIELIIADMGKAGATNTEIAYGVFNIIKTIFTGGSLGAVFSAFTASLSWWDMILYGITGLATIVAALATDGIAFVAEVIILLATFGFIVSDSVKAVQACSLPTPTLPANGTRLNDTSTGKVYLAIDDIIRWVPNEATYNNLFIDWNNIVSVPNVQDLVVGTDITTGARLANGTPDGKVFLLLEEGKRWITSADIFNKYGFSWSAIQTLTADELNAIQTASDIN